MKNEFTYVELSDEQLELVVGSGGSTNASQLGTAANFGGNKATNLQNANATNQVGFININLAVQNNINIIIII
jgi:hypothetical protein